MGKAASTASRRIRSRCGSGVSPASSASSSRGSCRGDGARHGNQAAPRQGLGDSRPLGSFGAWVRSQSMDCSARYGCCASSARSKLASCRRREGWVAAGPSHWAEGARRGSRGVRSPLDGLISRCTRRTCHARDAGRPRKRVLLESAARRRREAMAPSAQRGSAAHGRATDDAVGVTIRVPQRSLQCHRRLSLPLEADPQTRAALLPMDDPIQSAALHRRRRALRELGDPEFLGATAEDREEQRRGVLSRMLRLVSGRRR